MGEAYRGLTIRFQADGTKVLTTLRTMKRAANDVESELRQVKNALRFDASSAKAAQKQMQLLAERAALAGAKAERIRRELKDLGHVEFGGEKMKDLAAKTRDASTQASLLKTRYNSVDEALARLHNEMEQAWSSSKKLSSMPNPFKNWEHMPTEGIQRAISIMEQFGAVSKEESVRARSAVEALRAEWRLTSAEFEKAKAIARYQSFSNNLVKETAKAKAAMREMNEAAKAFRATGFEGKLTESRLEMDRLEAQARKLKQAMKLDPSSFAAVEAHASTLRARISAIEGETEDLRAEMRALGSEEGIAELAADTVKLTSNLRAARAGVDSVGDKLAAAKAKAAALAEQTDELRVKMHAAGDTEAGGEIRAQFESAESELKQVNAQVDELTANYRQAEEAVQRFNRAVRYSEASSSIMANNAAVAGLNNQMAERKKVKLLPSSAATSLGMSMYSTVYPAAMMAGTYAIQAADDVDSAYRNMRKTVQGTEEDFEALKKAALEFGDTHYTSADTMLEIEALGGQLGIQVENLGAFAKVVSDLSIATDDAFDAESISLWLGKMANIMHLNVEEYDNFADSLVRLGNSEPALESDIANITSRFAGMASIVGMAPDEILAIATAATATGQKAEAAGGSLMRTLGRIESATAGVSEGMRNLDDMTEEDIEEFEKAKDSLQDYADVAGMTAEEFAKSWQNAPTETFQKFVEGLKRIKDEGGSVEHTLKDVLGIGSIRDRQLLNGLTQTTDVLSDSLTMSKNAFNGVSDQWGDAGDAAREADKKCQGFSGALQELKNNGQHLASLMGESLVPVIRTITDLISGLVGAFAKLDPEVQRNITLALMGTAALGPLLTMYGAGSSALKGFRKGMEEYTSAGNRMARMEGSLLMRTSGATEKYRAHAKQIDSSRAKLEKYSAWQAKAVEITGKESSVLTTKINQTEKAMRSSQRYMGVMNKLSAVAGFAKGLGGMAAFTAGTVALEQGISAIVDYVEKAETYRKATDGMREAAERLKTTSTSGGGLFGQLASGVDTDWQAARAEMQETMAVNAEFVDSVNQRLDGVEENAMLVSYWADRLTFLSENFDGSETMLSELKTAVDNYNSATGSSITVVDDLTGRLSANTEEIQKNAQAYKDAMIAKAYSDVAADAAKQEAENRVRLQMAKDDLDAVTQARQNYISTLSAEELRMDEYGNILDSNVMAYDKQIETLNESVGAYERAATEAENLKNIALESAAAADKVATESQKEAQAISEAASSAKAYKKALSESGAGKGVFESLANDAGYAKDKLDEFAHALNDSGISAQNLASTGAEAFSRLYQEANGNLTAVNDAMNVINNFGFEPKQVTITQDGAIEVEGHIIDIQNRTIDDKVFTVDSSGTIGATDQETNDLLSDLGILGAKVATPTANLRDNASGGIDSVGSKLSSLDGRSATVSVYENTYQTTYKKTVNQGETRQAAGGVNMTLIRRIPAYARGAVLNGIVTGPLLTNQGLVGEAGAEAILRNGRQSTVVPLSNKRYVRPFAQAVASEMGGAQTSVVNNYYSLNGLTVQAGSDEARALEVLAGTMSRERRS